MIIVPLKFGKLRLEGLILSLNYSLHSAGGSGIKHCLPPDPVSAPASISRAGRSPVNGALAQTWAPLPVTWEPLRWVFIQALSSTHSESSRNISKRGKPERLYYLN